MAETNGLFGELDDKKEKICQAAIGIFNRKRFDKTTVSEIARAAGVGKGTFYLYFQSKDDLLHYLIEYGINQMINYVSARIENYADPVNKLAKAIDAQLEFFDDYRQYVGFFVREIWNYREGLKKEVTYLKENYIKIFEDVIKEGIFEGSLQNINPVTISSGLFGFLSISTVQWLIFTNDFPVSEIDRDIKNVFFRGILAGKNGTSQQVKDKQQNYR